MRRNPIAVGSRGRARYPLNRGAKHRPRPGRSHGRRHHRPPRPPPVLPPRQPRRRELRPLLREVPRAGPRDPDAAAPGGAGPAARRGRDAPAGRAGRAGVDHRRARARVPREQTPVRHRRPAGARVRGPGSGPARHGPLLGHSGAGGRLHPPGRARPGRRPPHLPLLRSAHRSRRAPLSGRQRGGAPAPTDRRAERAVPPLLQLHLPGGAERGLRAAGAPPGRLQAGAGGVTALGLPRRHPLPPGGRGLPPGQAPGLAARAPHRGPGAGAPRRGGTPAVRRRPTGAAPPGPRSSPGPGVDGDRRLRRPDQQRRPQGRALPHRRPRPGLDHRPRPDLPRRAQAAHGDLGLRRTAPAPAAPSRPGAGRRLARGRGAGPRALRPDRGGRIGYAAAASGDHPEPGVADAAPDLRLVGTLAARMRRLLAVPVAVLVWAVTLADTGPTPEPTPSPTSIPTPSTPVPTPVETPTPPHGIVGLSVAATPAGSQLPVTGSQFEPGEPIVLFLDTSDHQLGATVADQQGNFTQSVTIPDGAAQGSHIVCVQQQPQPRCAQLLVQAPLPSSTPTPTGTPTPEVTASPTVVPVTRGHPGILAGFLSSPLGLGIVVLLVAALIAAVVWVVRSRRGAGPRVTPLSRGYGRPLGPGPQAGWPQGRPGGPIPPPGAGRPGDSRGGPGPWSPGAPGQVPPPAAPTRGRQLPGQPAPPGARPPAGPLPQPRGWQPTRPGGPPPGWTPGTPLPPRRPPEGAGPAPWGPSGPRRPEPRGAPPGPVPPRGPILEGEAIPLPPPKQAEPKPGPAAVPEPEEEPPADPE